MGDPRPGAIAHSEHDPLLVDANPALRTLAADLAIDPRWMERKSPLGPVRVWDTESWIANSEDRVAGVIASMRSQGQSRTAGIYGGNVTVIDGATNDKLTPITAANRVVALAYNPDMVKNPPNTFEELVAWIKANPRKFGYNGVKGGMSGTGFVTGWVY